MLSQQLTNIKKVSLFSNGKKINCKGLKRLFKRISFLFLSLFCVEVT